MVRKPTDLGVEFGARLRVARVAIGRQTQQAMADDIGAPSLDAYEKWENGVSTFPPHAAVRMGKLFNVSTDYIYAGRVDSLPPPIQKKVLLIEQLAQECEARLGRPAAVMRSVPVDGPEWQGEVYVFDLANGRKVPLDGNRVYAWRDERESGNDRVHVVLHSGEDKVTSPQEAIAVAYGAKARAKI